MAQDSWPSPNHSSGAVTEAEFEDLAKRFSDDGVDGSPADTAVCSAGAGLQVTVRSDVYASVRGFTWYSGSVDDNLTIASNSSGQTRIDRVVVRLDRSTWDVRAAVVQGTPGSGAPSVTQNTDPGGVWEIPLASVTVIDSATSVTVTRGEQYVGGRIRPCTSTTRPPNPRRGDQILETDTGELLLWTGTSWELLFLDSGEVTLGAGNSTWEDSGNTVGRRIGRVVTLRISKRRITQSISAGAPASTMATVPSSLRPISRNHYTGCTFSNGVTGNMSVLTSGIVSVQYLSGTVTPSTIVDQTITYLRY